MLDEYKGKMRRVQFDSMDEMNDYCAAHGENLAKNGGYDYEFTHVHSGGEALQLAREGWTEHMDETLEVSSGAVELVEKEYKVKVFEPTWDVAGCEVDVARYLNSEPENMIDYPLTEIVKAGRVITLCASTTFSAAVSTESIIRRGQAAVALALALGRLGYEIEIWADLHGTVWMGGDETVQVRTLVKSVYDVLDPERILYALAHPSMLRVMQFTVLDSAERSSWATTSWMPKDPIKDMPEGTIYLPCLSGKDVPDADKQLVRYLKQLEIIPEGD